MVRREFDKPALTIEEQLSLLKSRGLLYNDKTFALEQLSQLNYYRLEGYWLPLEANHDKSSFIKKSLFDKVIEWYNTDCKLRTILFEAISVIEVSFRTKYAYFMANKYGPFSYLDKRFIDNKYLTSKQNGKSDWEKCIDKIKDEVNRSTASFIKHFNDTYLNPLPPIWMTAEVLSFGTLSHLYSMLNTTKPLDPLDKLSAKDAIAKEYNLDRHLLQSWTRSINTIRNLCAHQSRLIFSYFKSQPQKPKKSNNPLYNNWYNQLKMPNNTKIIIPNNSSIKNVLGESCTLLSTSVGETLQTGSIVYLPNNSVLTTENSQTMSLPENSILRLPISQTIIKNNDSEILLPEGTIINIPFNSTLSNDIGIKSNTNFYDIILVIDYFYKIITKSNLFQKQIKELLSLHSECAIMLGFPSDWESLKTWK